MKYKIITVVVVSLVLVAASCPLSFAETPPSIDSAMSYPGVFYSGTSLQYIVESYDSGVYGLWVIEVSLSQANAYCFIEQYVSHSFWSTVPFTGRITHYNAASGAVIQTNTFESRSQSYTLNGVTYTAQASFSAVPGTRNYAFYDIPDSDRFFLHYTQGTTNIINWAPVVPSIHSYSSYLSEPIADPYNRYIVLAGEDEQYIFLLSFSLSDLMMFNSQSVNQGADEIDLMYNHVFIPTLKLDEDQLKLEIDVNPQIFYILNNTDNHLYTYNLMLGKYRLVDGQYISSTLYNGTISSATTSLSFDFGTVSDYDSIKTYGVEYIDMLTSQWHFNFLHCSWGHDPEFETWKQNVLYYLEQIYNLMNTPEDETVTISDDMSAVNDMESAKQDLVVTDASGAAVDPAEVAEQNFSEAASQIGELAEPVSTVNGLMSSLIFDKPKLVLPIIVALALGLMVTILGKNKSD